MNEDIFTVLKLLLTGIDTFYSLALWSYLSFDKTEHSTSDKTGYYKREPVLNNALKKTFETICTRLNIFFFLKLIL